MQNLSHGASHPVVVFRDPAGFKLTRQAWMKVNCDSEALATILLQKNRVKIEGTVAQTLLKNYKVRLKAKELFIMPSFNDFLRRQTYQ